MAEHRLSVVVLAGGKSTRMGRDKAFLKLNGRNFVTMITDEALKVSDDVIVAIGTKTKESFSRVLNKRVAIVSDSYFVWNPIGGMLSAIGYAKHRYVAVLACDLPLVNSNLLEFLFVRCQNHSAAIPLWADGAIEPLCAVYHLSEMKKAGVAALKKGMIGPKYMIALLDDVQYVKVSELKAYDKDLLSFLNVNTREDYVKLKRETLH